MTEPTLYDRLGGVFAIAAVVDHFSDAVVQNPIVGQKSENPDLREWHTNNLGRLPGAASGQVVYGDVRVILMAGLSRPLPVPSPPLAQVRTRPRRR